MSSEDILTPGVRRNLAELYISGLVTQDVDKYNGYYFLTVLFETGQQGDFLFDQHFRLVSSRYVKPNLEPKNPIKVYGYKVDRVGREINAHLSDVDKQETDVMCRCAKVLPKTS
jgi:hypothetical protein